MACRRRGDFRVRLRPGHRPGAGIRARRQRSAGEGRRQTVNRAWPTSRGSPPRRS
jgi:hypothetical protein